jgi:acyl-CoA hydrolase
VLQSGERRICGHGSIVMVALDEQDQPTRVQD